MFAIIFDSAGFGEWFILLAVVLIVVGPKKLPSVARTIGNYYARLRRAADSFKRQILDMDTEFSKAVEESEKMANDAFSIDGDEASAIPSDPENPYDDGNPDGTEMLETTEDLETLQSAANAETAETPEQRP